MNTITLRLQTVSGPVEIPAVEVVPGLALHKEQNHNYPHERVDWCVTHAASGLALNKFAKKIQAVAYCQAIAGLFPWERDALTLPWEIKQSLRDAANKARNL